MYFAYSFHIAFVIWKWTDTFRISRVCHGEEVFLGWIYKRQFYIRKFFRISTRNLSYFLFANNILYVGIFQGNSPREIFRRIKFLWDFVMQGWMSKVRDQWKNLCFLTLKGRTTSQGTILTYGGFWRT